VGHQAIVGCLDAELVGDGGALRLLAYSGRQTVMDGRLTQEEFQKIRIHPQVGAEIIAGVPFPYPVAPLILSHHERWDGKGYPAMKTPDFTDKGWQAQHPDEELIEAVTKGKGTMPPSERKMKPEEIKAVIVEVIRKFAR
jgi:hypothetical protein